MFKILVGGSVPALWFKLIRLAEEVPSQRQRAREETGGQPMESDKRCPPADNSGLQKMANTPLLIRSNHNRMSQRGEETAERGVALGAERETEEKVARDDSAVCYAGNASP